MKKKYIPFIAGSFALFLVGGILIGMNINKKSKNKKNNTNDDPRYKIYLKAVDAGYEGTYEDWLLSIRGDEVELRVADNYIQMKYKQSTIWSNLISLDSLKGPKGDTGNDGLSIKSQLQVSDGYIQYKNENETTWANLIAISDLTGAKGDKLELNIDNGYINYKYENDTDWTGLIELSTLTGSNGKEVIMSVESDYIVWKYDGETSWNNLVSIDTLKGSQGDKGEKSIMQVANGFIQWKNENDSSWTDLISIETITGNNGKEITLSTDSNYIVWKYVGDDTWTNLVSFETLKGDKGEDGGKTLLRVSDGYIQWKNENDSEWFNLISLDEITGSDAKEIELRKTETEIQWRYKDEIWNTLLLISDITINNTPYIGENGNWWINDTDTNVFAGYQGTFTITFKIPTPLSTYSFVDSTHVNENGDYVIEVQGGKTITCPEISGTQGYAFSVLGWYTSVDQKSPGSGGGTICFPSLNSSRVDNNTIATSDLIVYLANMKTYN